MTNEAGDFDESDANSPMHPADLEALKLYEAAHKAAYHANDQWPTVMFLRNWIARDRRKTRAATLKEASEMLTAEYGVTNRAASFLGRLADEAGRS